MKAGEMRRGVRSLAIAAVLVTLVGAGAAARAGIGSMLPGSATLGPPDWVKPGVRISFYVAGATVANAEHQWQEDPDGGWRDPVTGKRYSQADVATSSGEGYAQVDVVGIDGADVALEWVLYGLDRTAGRFFGGGAGGAREPGAAPEDFWIHPQLLADIPEADLPDLKILRGDYTVGDTAYRGLGIVDPTPLSYTSHIYDLASGLLLSGTTSTQANASPLHIAGEDPPEASTQITITRIADVRQREAAGVEAGIPGWAAGGATLAYQGSWTFVNPYDPNAGPLTYPARMSVILGAGGPTWLSYRSSLVVDIAGFPQTTEGTGVASGNGPYWIDPAVLSAARQGALVDEDPVTGQRTLVSWVGEGPVGRAVTISTEMPGIATSGTFDAGTGVLLAATRSEAGSGITTQLGLVSMP